MKYEISQELRDSIVKTLVNSDMPARIAIAITNELNALKPIKAEPKEK